MAVRRRDVVGELGEMETAGEGADAKQHAPRMGAEIIPLRRSLEDRHHPGEAGAAGNAQDILVFLDAENRPAERTKDSDLGAFSGFVDKPIAEPSTRLALENKGNTVDLGFKIHDRIGASAGQIRGPEHYELPGFEAHGRG